MIILLKSVISMFLGFIITIILGFIIIPVLKKLHVTQNVSKHLNERHIKKNGTPTFGGIIFLFATLITIILLLFIMLSYFILGFIDDYLKIKYHNNKGLSILTKLSIQIFISLIFFAVFIYTGNNLTIYFLSYNIDLKFLYGFLILFMLTGSSNAVNITDGLDGLASGLCAISFITYGIIAFNSNYILGYEEIGVFCFILAGSLFGFLFFNFYPAKIFMGDLGSLTLGALLAAIAIILKCELSLVLIGFIYIIETISSFIQIFSIRYFKRKIFLKSPLHHHFEELGLMETDIIKIFYTLGLIFSIITLIIYVL